jgi:Flp pilus assembly pilin Flp
MRDIGSIRTDLIGGDGQGLVEYALILVLVAIVVIAALQFIGTQLADEIQQIGNSV